MGISDIVLVSVSLSMLSPALTNFGVPLLCAYHEVGVGGPKVRTYASPEEAVTDGHPENSSVVRCLRKMFGQSPTVPAVKVGRRSTANQQTIHFTPTIFGAPAVGTVYKLTIQDGTTEVDITYTTLVSDTTAALVATGLKTAIDAEAIAGLTTSVVSGKLVCVADDGLSFGFVKYSTWLTVSDETPTTNLVTDLAAITLEDPGYYGVITDVGSKAGILAVAGVVEAQHRLYVADTPDSACADGGSSSDVLASLETLAYRRTLVHCDTAVGQWAMAALMALEFTKEPGASTWAFKTLAGVYPTTWNTTELAALDGKRGNYYQTIAGVNVTQHGRTPGGFIDVMRGLDWLVAGIQTRVFGVMLRNNKVPYTDAGIEAIKGEVYAQLDLGAGDPYNFVAEGFTVTAPKVVNVPGADKDDRVLRNVKFSATLQGAIQKVVVAGELVS